MKTTNDRDHLRDRIAHEFTKLLKEALTAEQWAEMVKANAAEPDNRICASHDYCDANMVMAEAWDKVMGRATALQSDADTSLWNAAWAEAKRIWQAERPAAPAPVAVEMWAYYDSHGMPGLLSGSKDSEKHERVVVVRLG